MTFFVEKDEGIEELPLPCEEIFRQVAGECLAYTGCPYECQVTLTLTDDEGIHEMNREFRDVDAPTDVLSFPMTELAAPGDFSSLEPEDPDCFDPETGELMLGDIVISVDRVRAQAGEYGHSLKREYAFLIAHSMLHLQGFDHMEASDRKIMEEAQENIMEKLGIRREF